MTVNEASPPKYQYRARRVGPERPGPQGQERE